jgi:tape measure domain-containing protein
MSQSVGSIHYDLSLKTAQFDAAVNSTNAKVATLGEKFTAAGASMMKVGAILTVASAAVVYTGAKFVSLASDLETTQQRMAALSGSTEEAKQIMGELYTYVLGKPIAFPDASKAAQTLMGYGVSSKKVVESMKTLSAFSIVNGADLGQLALAYGQVNAKGKLMGQEVLQLTNNFVPIGKVLQQFYKEDMPAVQARLEDGKISAEDFNQAMAQFIPQEKIAAMANTFKNRMISLQGSVRSFGLALIGVKVDKQLGLVVEPGGVFDTMSKILPKIAKVLSIVGGAFKALPAPVKKATMVVTALLLVLGPLLLVIGAVTVAMGFLAANPAVLAIAAIVLAVAGLIGFMVYLEDRFKTFTKLLQALQPYIKIVTDTFKELWVQLKEVAQVITKDLQPVIDYLKEHIEGVKQVLKVLLIVGFIPLIETLMYIIAVIKLVTKAIEFSLDVYDQLKEKVKKTASDIADYITAVKKAWNDLVNAVEIVIDRIKNKIDGWVDSAKEKLETFKGFLKDTKKVINDAMAAGKDSDSFVKGVDKINDKLAGYINGTLSNWKTSITSTWDSLKESATGFVDTASNSLSSFVRNTAQSLSLMWAGVKQTVKTTVEDIKNNVKELPDKIKGNLTTGFNNLFESFAAFMRNLPQNLMPHTEKAGSDTAKNITDSTKNNLMSMDKIRAVGDAIGTLIGLAVLAMLIYIADLGFRIGRQLLQGAINGIGAMGGALWGSLSNTFASIGNFFAGAWSWLYGAGRMIVQGLIWGIGDMAGAVYNKAAEIANNVTKTIRKALDVHSPSRVMYEVGTNVGQGLIDGIDSSINSVKAMSNAMAASVIPNMQEQGTQTSSTNIYGNIQIGDQQTADYFLSRLNRGSDLSSMGLGG